MRNFYFQPGSTWRKLGFTLYSNSLSYRDILNDNPNWTVTENPPVGTELVSSGGTAFTSSAGLSQQSPVIPTESFDNSLTYYPFDSEEGYLNSLFRYSPSALRGVERENGWSQNSTISDTGELG